MDDISNSESDSDYQLEYEFFEDGEDEGGERASDLDESEGLSEVGSPLIEDTEPVPSRAGRELMKRGDFGSEEWESYPSRSNPLRKPCPQYLRLLEREIGAYRGVRARMGAQLIAQKMLPRSHAEFVMHYDNRCYSGQFSNDGNLFYSCCQDLRLRMYDTSNPYNWRYCKTVPFPDGRWTITDATLSPDNKMVAYCGLSSVVYTANTSSENGEITAHNFYTYTGQHRVLYYGWVGILSIRFSGDGRELVAGGNDNNVHVYDLETQKKILILPAHEDDVNAVCFADINSPNILYSGSDDTTIRVWDRRSMASAREVGGFCGHLEGLTYIESKGDGRYILSNGKEHTMKLWDIRKMLCPSTFDVLKHSNQPSGYDYRSPASIIRVGPHPNDCSVVTFRGHQVRSTLIRCHFSPPTSSGSRYVYTGSSDGKVYIYNLDGTIASIIDVHRETFETRPLCRERDSKKWDTCVRDASWHPNATCLAASSWNGYGFSTGTVTLHSWSSSTDPPARLNCWGEVDPSFYVHQSIPIPGQEGDDI